MDTNPSSDKTGANAGCETSRGAENGSKRNSHRRKFFTKKKTQRRTEIDQISEKYKVFLIDHEIFQIIMIPSDPQFPFPIPLLSFDLHLSRHYPNQGPDPWIAVKNDDIPKGNAINIEHGFKKFTGSLLSRVEQLDENLEALLTIPAARTVTIVRSNKQTERKTPELKTQNNKESNLENSNYKEISEDNDSVKDMKEHMNFNKLSLSEIESSSSESVSNSDSDSELQANYEHPSDEEDIDTGIKHQYDQPKKEGTELLFSDIKMTNISLCEISSLNILLQCGRCKTPHTFLNLQSAEYGRSSKPRAELCGKCDLPLLAAFRKEFLHSVCHTAGYIDVDGGKVVDLLPSTYLAVCGSCQQFVPPFKNLDIGAQRMMNCRNCHSKLWLQVELFSLVILSTDTLDSSSKKTERAKLPPSASKQQLRLTGGEPLPEKGTCSHYRKSTRWFRFTCCQRVFPCDQCHDLEMQHPCDLASRMVCGYCSREQKFSMKCFYCEHDYSSRVSRFWEGGKGVRDKKLMSRKDKRKYKRDPVENKKKETHFQGKSNSVSHT